MAKNKTQTATDTAAEPATVKQSAPEGTFKRVSSVTTPTIKMLEGGSYYFRMEEPIRTEKTQTKNDDGKMVETDIRVVKVVNLETGQIGQIVAGKVLDKELNRKYPNDGYVGKCFEIEKSKHPGGKRYRNYAIFEIADPSADKGKTKK